MNAKITCNGKYYRTVIQPKQFRINEMLFAVIFLSQFILQKDNMQENYFLRYNAVVRKHPISGYTSLPLLMKLKLSCRIKISVSDSKVKPAATHSFSPRRLSIGLP